MPCSKHHQDVFEISAESGPSSACPDCMLSEIHVTDSAYITSTLDLGSLVQSSLFGFPVQELSLRLAEKENARIVLATDPDADRLAVAELQEK